MPSVLALILLQSVSSMAADDPLKPMREVVVDAIRDCGKADRDGDIKVCSRDRGVAEGYRPMKKLEKPKVITNGPPINITVSVDSLPVTAAP